MEKKHPIHKINDRRLSASVWANQTQCGQTIHSVTFTRLYRQGEELRHANSFSRSDLLALAKLAEAACAFLNQQRK